MRVELAGQGFRITRFERSDYPLMFGDGARPSFRSFMSDKAEALHARLQQSVYFGEGGVVGKGDDTGVDLLVQFVVLEPLAGKGHIVSRNGATAMIYLPRHLLGLEAATSVLEMGINGRSTGAQSPRPRFDLVAIAQADFNAGTVLSATGHHHSIENVSATLVPASPLQAEHPAPFYSQLTVDWYTRWGSAARYVSDIALGESSLLTLRRQQDTLFFPQVR
jgi:predicted homoserine dehydrogenase-like protein